MTNNVLNDNADGPHAFSNRKSVEHWNNTQWLIDYVEDNIDVNDADWAEWDDAEHIRTTYWDDRDGADDDTVHVEIGERGAQILNAAISGEDWEPLMRNWSRDIEDEE